MLFVHIYFGYNLEVDLPPLKEKADKRTPPRKGEVARSDGGVTNFKAYPYVCYPSALAGHLPFPGRSFDQAPPCRDDPWGVHDEHAKTIGSSLQHTQKLPQKTHCGVNKFALRYAYSHTAVQIYFDCGANFAVFYP